MSRPVLTACAAQRRRLVGACIAISALALVGGVFLVDGYVRDSGPRYKLCACLLGALLTVPLWIVVLLRARGLRLLKLVTFALVPTLGLLGVAEIVLRVFDVETFEAPRLVQDERLGHIMAADSPGSDDWGFRNPSVPDQADVVFIGDSQTYGFGLVRSSSYPYQFGAITGMRIYGMAHGGYGPVQYRELVGRAMKLRPAAVVVGLYFGNDVADAHSSAFLEGCADLRQPGHSYRIKQFTWKASRHQIWRWEWSIS